jgi:hypothetical protein
MAGYHNADEIISAALNLLESGVSKNRSILNAFVEGVHSGFESNFDPRIHLLKLHSKHLLQSYPMVPELADENPPPQVLIGFQQDKHNS